MVRKRGLVSYEIYHPDKGKVKQTYHINLLKQWKEPQVKQAKQETAMMLMEVTKLTE